MNPDILSPGERCAATSNRNFEGRQGKGGRTHLVSPAMAAAAAVAGHFVDVRACALKTAADCEFRWGDSCTVAPGVAVQLPPQREAT